MKVLEYHFLEHEGEFCCCSEQVVTVALLDHGTSPPSNNYKVCMLFVGWHDSLSKLKSFKMASYILRSILLLLH